MGAGPSILTLCQSAKVILYDEQVACYNANAMRERMHVSEPAEVSGNNARRGDVVIRLADDRDNPRTVHLVSPTTPASSVPCKVVNPMFVSTFSLSHLRHEQREKSAPCVHRGPFRTYPRLSRKQPPSSHRRTRKDYIDLLYQEYPVCPVPGSRSLTVRLLPKVCFDRGHVPIAVHPLYACHALEEGHVIARAVYKG